MQDPRVEAYDQTIAALEAQIAQLRESFPGGPDNLAIVIDWVKLIEEHSEEHSNGYTSGLSRVVDLTSGI